MKTPTTHPTYRTPVELVEEMREAQALLLKAQTHEEIGRQFTAEALHTLNAAHCKVDAELKAMRACAPQRSVWLSSKTARIRAEVMHSAGSGTSRRVIACWGLGMEHQRLSPL